MDATGLRFGFKKSVTNGRTFQLRTKEMPGRLELLEIEIRRARVRGEEEIDQNPPGFCLSFSGQALEPVPGIRQKIGQLM